MKIEISWCDFISTNTYTLGVTIPTGVEMKNTGFKQLAGAVWILFSKMVIHEHSCAIILKLSLSEK